MDNFIQAIPDFWWVFMLLAFAFIFLGPLWLQKRQDERVSSQSVVVAGCLITTFYIAGIISSFVSILCAFWKMLH